ncbi:MAG: hypothetical protein ACRER0_00130 [Gammaproteobacteria bacterium]
MNDDTETDFLYKTHARFMDNVANLDARVVSRLREARTLAVAEAGRHQPVWRARRWTLPAGAVAIAFAGVTTGLLWWSLGSQPAVPFAADSSQDMAIVLSSDNLDMYADMDFYSWLQAQQQSSDPNNSTGNNNG